MSLEEMMFLATELEGHPDNVAAAIYGGATIAWMENIYGVQTGRAVTIPVHPEIKATLFIPEYHLSTSKARKLLPETISHHDAVLNSSHAALLSIAPLDRQAFRCGKDLLHHRRHKVGLDDHGIDLALPVGHVFGIGDQIGQTGHGDLAVFGGKP